MALVEEAVLAAEILVITGFSALRCKLSFWLTNPTSVHGEAYEDRD